jgi:serine/threonine protein kinase
LLFKRLPFCSLSEVKAIDPPMYKGFDTGADLVNKLLAKNPYERISFEEIYTHNWFL